VDVNGQWEQANGPKPNPEDVHIGTNRGHIGDGDGDRSGSHLFDSGMPSKTVFPPDWDNDDETIGHLIDVARNPDNPPVYDDVDGTWRATGTRDGVDIETIVTPDGEILSGFPPVVPECTSTTRRATRSRSSRRADDGGEAFAGGDGALPAAEPRLAGAARIAGRPAPARARREASTPQRRR
jgi:hypothetical protein